MVKYNCYHGEIWLLSWWNTTVTMVKYRYLSYCYLETLPWQWWSVEIHEDVAQTFHVIPSRLFYSQMGIDWGVPGCACGGDSVLNTKRAGDSSTTKRAGDSSTTKIARCSAYCHYYYDCRLVYYRDKMWNVDTVPRGYCVIPLYLWGSCPPCRVCADGFYCPGTS